MSWHLNVATATATHAAAHPVDPSETAPMRAPSSSPPVQEKTKCHPIFHPHNVHITYRYTPNQSHLHEEEKNRTPSMLSLSSHLCPNAAIHPSHPYLILLVSTLPLTRNPP
jgi:hypothetical protein